MGGNKTGGLKAAQTLKQQKGPDWFQRIGKLGGTVSRGGGFTKETASVYGRIGGSISRKGNSPAMAKAREDARRKLNQPKYDQNYQRLRKVAEAAKRERAGK